MKARTKALVALALILAIANPVRADTFSATASFEVYANGQQPGGLTAGSCGTYTVDTTTAAPGGGSNSLKAVMGSSTCGATFQNAGGFGNGDAYSWWAKLGNDPPSSSQIFIGAVTNDFPYPGAFGEGAVFRVDENRIVSVIATTDSLTAGHPYGSLSTCTNSCKISLNVWYQFTITFVDTNSGQNCHPSDTCEVDFSVCGGDLPACHTGSAIFTNAFGICSDATPQTADCQFDSKDVNFGFRGPNTGSAVTVWYDLLTTTGLTASGSGNYDFALIVTPSIDAGLAIPAFGKDIGYTSIVGQFLFGLVLAAVVFVVMAGSYAGLTNQAPGSTWIGTVGFTGMAVYNVLSGIWPSWVGVILVVITAGVITALVKGWLFGGRFAANGGGQGG